MTGGTQTAAGTSGSGDRRGRWPGCAASDSGGRPGRRAYRPRGPPPFGRARPAGCRAVHLSTGSSDDRHCPSPASPRGSPWAAPPTASDTTAERRGGLPARAASAIRRPAEGGNRPLPRSLHPRRRLRPSQLADSSSAPRTKTDSPHFWPAALGIPPDIPTSPSCMTISSA